MKEAFRESKDILKKVGVSLFLFLTVFGFLKDFVLIPLLGKLWGLVLKTTPDGFISDSNVAEAVLGAPWLIPAGAVLLLAFALITMWQISAAMFGIGYAFQGKKARIRDLFLLSLGQIKKSALPRNWMVFVYTLILLPLCSSFQVNDLISSFIIPEYIGDFINSKPLLSAIYAVLILGITYTAFRWFYLIPSYILKNSSFREAKKESVRLSGGRWLKDGCRILIYNICELVRLILLPLILILIPSVIAYLLTSKLEYSTSLFNLTVLSVGAEAIRSITAALVTISLMCYLVNEYRKRLKEQDSSEEFVLPELKKEASEGRVGIVTVQTVCSLISAVLITGSYLALVLGAQKDPDLIMELTGRTYIIAHKGYSSRAPENTMPAFELADRSSSVDFIELDVWSTSDGIPVVIHNRSIEDATGVDKDVTGCTYEELSKLTANYAMPAEDFPDARIPALEDVIKKYSATTPILIEIKGFPEDPELPSKIVALMKKYGCEDTSMIQSGDYGALKAVKEADPEISCGLILALVTGDFFNLPYADFFSVEHTFISRSTVNLLHRHGKAIFAWTVNYPESAEKLRFSGVDGLITDDPDDIAAYVSDKNDMLLSAYVNSFLNALGPGRSFEDIDYRKGEY